MRREAIGELTDRGEEKFLLDLKSKIESAKFFSEALASPLADNGIRHHQHHGYERE
jgi:hypothetical protein